MAIFFHLRNLIPNIFEKDQLSSLQVTSAISNNLLAKAKNTKLSFGHHTNLNFDFASFPLDDSKSIDLYKIKSKEFYWLSKYAH